MIDLCLIRGGSWLGLPWLCRSARGPLQPDDAGSDVGFRVVCLHQAGHTIRLEEQTNDWMNDFRMIRGGSWNDPLKFCSPACSVILYLNDRENYAGFRICCPNRDAHTIHLNSNNDIP